MIFYKWGTEAVPLGSAGVRPCPGCGEACAAEAALTYWFFALYWIFSVAGGRKYHTACTSCRHTAEVDRASLGPVADRAGIPFLRRFGLPLLVGGLILLALVGAF